MRIVGDCREVLATLPKGSVQTCVTSPPYWGLRDYGVKKQIGLERTPELFVQEMVEVFRLVREVLSDDGTDAGAPYKTLGAGTKASVVRGDGGRKVLSPKGSGGGGQLATYQRNTIGWRPTCAHNCKPVPDVVLDPFLGAGTTAMVAEQLGRAWIGIELNRAYSKLAREAPMAEAA